MLNRTATQLYLSLHWFVCILTPLKHMNTGNLALTLFERGWLQKKFVTACPNFCRSSRSEFLQEFPFQCETQQDFRQDRAKIWAAGYLFFGEIRDRIQRDFGCGDFCFSARILTGFTAGSRQDFDRREFRFPARILPESYQE